jgi:hypothetical protein
LDVMFLAKISTKTEVLSVFFGGSNPVLVDGGPARLLLVPGWNNVSLALLPGPHSLSEAGGTRCTFSLALPGPAVRLPAVCLLFRFFIPSSFEQTDHFAAGGGAGSRRAAAGEHRQRARHDARLPRCVSV